MPDSAVIVQMRQWKAALLREESVQMRQMANAWLGVERALDGNMAALAERMSNVARDGGTVTEGMLWQESRYRILLSQLNDELGKYTRYADRTITDRQAQLARLGIDHAARAIEAQGVRAGFARLPVEAVQNMVGLAGDGSPLRSLLQASWPDAAQGMTSALVRGVALGYNPRKVARMMAAGSTRSLDRMMKVARTEQLRVYRESSRQSYINSGVVSSYARLCAHDKRVCPACLMDEGHVYELNEEMPEHVQGRCTLVPYVKGVPNPQWKKGEEWFNEQDADTQTSILGKGKYEAWQAGRFDLGELVTVKPNATWGDSLQVTPLRDLAGPRVARAIDVVAPIFEMLPTFEPYISRATGQVIESTYTVGRFGDIPVAYREMSFTDKRPDAAAMRKIAEEVINPALSRVPAAHRDLIEYIIVQDFDAGFAMGGHADLRGITIDAIRGEAQIGPSGIVHEAGHLVHKKTLTNEQARAWAAATGWKDPDTALDMMINATSKDMRPYEYIGATEYGTFHPVEAFAESYRLKYQGDLTDLDGLIVYPEARDTLGALLDRILE